MTKNDDLKGKAIKLSEFIGYKKDSIVSKTMVDKKIGTLTLFSFDQGQGLSEHTSPFDAVVYLLDGDAEILIDGKPVKAKKGEMVIMPASVSHALKAVKRFKMMLIMIRS